MKSLDVIKNSKSIKVKKDTDPRVGKLLEEINKKEGELQDKINKESSNEIYQTLLDKFGKKTIDFDSEEYCIKQIKTCSKKLYILYKNKLNDYYFSNVGKILPNVGKVLQNYPKIMALANHYNSFLIISKLHMLYPEYNRNNPISNAFEKRCQTGDKSDKKFVRISSD